MQLIQFHKEKKVSYDGLPIDHGESYHYLDVERFLQTHTVGQSETRTRRCFLLYKAIKNVRKEWKQPIKFYVQRFIHVNIKSLKIRVKFILINKTEV